MEGGFAFRALELYLTQVAALKRDFSPEFQLNSREILKWKPLHGEKETHPFPSKQRAHSVVLCWGCEEQGAVAVAMVGRAVSAGIFLGVLFL